MLNKILQAVLSKYFGEFMTGIENIQLGIWSGKINLQNTSLKHDKMNQILQKNNVPLNLKYSSIGSLSIDIPWNKLLSTPVEVKISEVLIIFKIEKIKFVDKKGIQDKIFLIRNYAEQLIKKAMKQAGSKNKAGQENSEAGYSQKIILKIINNLNFEVKNISIRIESDDEQLNQDYQQFSEPDQSMKNKRQSKNSQDIKSYHFNRQSGQSYNSQQLSSESSRKRKKGLAFGFCIENFSSHTVDEDKNPTYYQLETEKSSLLKMIKFTKISAYWESENQFRIFKHGFEEKNRILQSLIARKQFRLLTIDGDMMVRKNYQIFDYLLQMNLEILEIQSTYSQLQGMIKVYSNFSRASQSKFLSKMEELEEKEQQKLKQKFIRNFILLYKDNFKKRSYPQEFEELIRKISKKNLLSWTKQQAILIIKETKIENLKKLKNKKGWFGFLADKAQIQLTKEEEAEARKEVEKIIQELEKNQQHKMQLGLIFHLNELKAQIVHSKMGQSLKIRFRDTQLRLVKLETQKQIFFEVADLGFIYEDQKKNISSFLLKKYLNEEQNGEFFKFSIKDTKQKIKVFVLMKQLQINHESQVLLLLSELIKLKQKQDMGSDVALKKIQLNWKIQKQDKAIKTQQISKNYQIDITLQAIRFKIQVSQHAYLMAIVQGITINTQNGHHKGSLLNFSLIYSKGLNNSSPILNNLTIIFLISNSFKKITTKIQMISLLLCEDDLRNIYRHFKRQFQSFRTQKISQKNIRIQQSCIMQGKLKILTIIRDWRQYYAKLTQDSLYFYDSSTEISSEQLQQKPVNIIPLKNATVSIVNQSRFKIQSEQINELIECDEQVCEAWAEMIEKVIFECSSRQKIYEMINADSQNKKEIIKNSDIYERQFIIQVATINVIFCQTIGRNIAEFVCCSLQIKLKEDAIKFCRSFSVAHFYLKNCEPNIDNDLVHILSNSPSSKDKEHYPLSLSFSGNKKPHPDYKSELNIDGNLQYLKINYDAEFIYRIAKRIAWNFQIPCYTRQMRDAKILQLTKKYLQSSDYQNKNQKFKHCKNIDEQYSKYMQLQNFKKFTSANVMLKVRIVVKSTLINLLNGRNNICVFQAQASNLGINLDKGSSFMFLKVNGTDFTLFDTTNYPNTSTKPWEIPINMYPLIHLQQNRNNKQCFQCLFSRFSLESFMNKDRIKSFFGLNLYDLHINYQNQPINRFFDYLLNQIIGFLMAPHQLHKYDGPIRGPFKYYEYLDMTEKQIKDIIQSSVHPFFTKIIITGFNLDVLFNSHPNQEGIPLHADEFKFQSHHYENPDRIKFKNNQLIKIQKHEIFQQLLKNQTFQEKILKNHWGCKFGIVVSGCKSAIIDNDFEFSIIIQRVINSEKGIIYPFLEIDSNILCKSWIQNLSVRAPKDVYNLINRCMMHNVSYDDKCDKHFFSNYEFRNLMPQNQLYYSLKARELSIVIPEQQLVLAIPEFQYIFIRYPSMVKKMYVYGKSLSILGQEECLMMPNERPEQHYTKDRRRSNRNSENIQSSIEDIRCFEYQLQMQNDGTKIMSVLLKSVEIAYNLQKFMALLQYFLLDQSCYPIATDLSDLPLIICDVHLKNTFVKLLKINNKMDNVQIESNLFKMSQENMNNSQEQSCQFVGTGNINLIWTRNKVMHPQRYEKDPQIFPSGTQWCNYKINIKDFYLRRYYQTFLSKESNINSMNLSLGSHSFDTILRDYRSLSNAIQMSIQISQLMKMSRKGQKYNDNIFTISIHSFMLRMCFKDIEEIKNHLAEKSQKQEKNKQQQKLKKKESMQEEIIQQKQDMSQNQSMRENYDEQIRPQNLGSQNQIIAYTKYSINIKRLSVQFGLSELPVPIFDIFLKNTALNMQFIGHNKNIALEANLFSSYWNMQIGKWQPIIEKFTPKINLRLGKPSKHIIMDCHQSLNIDISMQALKVLSILYSDIQEKGRFSILKNQSTNNVQAKGSIVSPYVLCNQVGCPILVSSQIVRTARLNSNEKMYIDLQSLNIQKQEEQKISFRVQPAGKQNRNNSSMKIKQQWQNKQIRLDEAVTKRISVKSNTHKNYQLFLKVTSTTIIKQLILSSPYQIQNRTSYPFIFRYDCFQIKVDPNQKLALNFMANMKRKYLKIQFPFLQGDFSEINFLNAQQQGSSNRKIIENCEFPFEVLTNGYEHQITLSDGNSFNFVISIDEDPQITIVVEPAFYIKNLLPFQLPIQFLATNQKKEKTLHAYRLEVNQQKSLYDFNNQGNINQNNNIIENFNKKVPESKISVRVKIRGYNNSPIQPIIDPNNPYEYRTYLDLIDYRGNPGSISMKVLKDGKVRRIYFYSEAVLINQTKFNWFAFLNSNKLLPGQRLKLKQNIVEIDSPYILINQPSLNKNTSSVQKNISFGFREDTKNSNEVSINQIGLQEVTSYKGSAMYEFTVKNTLNCLDNVGKIYSNILKAQPKYVLVNETECYLNIAQNNVFNKVSTLKPNDRINWVWPNKSQPKNIIMKLVENETELPDQQWDYSAQIKISEIQEEVFVLRPKSKKNLKKILQIMPIFQYQSTFILIKEVSKTDDYLITIKNQLQLCRLSICQEVVDEKNPIWIDNKYVEISPNSKQPFGWDYPNQPENIVVVVSFLSYMKSQFKPFQFRIDTSTQQSVSFSTSNEDSQIFQICVQVQIIGRRKILTFQQKQNVNDHFDDQLQLMHGGDKIGFSFSQIGVSIISRTNNNFRVQILYLTLQKMQLIMMEKKTSRTLQLKIKYINIDNNMAHNTIYPILLTPLKHQKTLKKSRPFFVMIMEETLSNAGGVKQIKEFRVCLQPISVKIHDQILVAVFQMFKVVGKIRNDDRGYIDLLPIYRAYYPLMQWQEQKLQKPAMNIFIRELEIARLSLEITFSIRPKFNSENFIITTILSSFGVAISNVSEAQLTLSRFSRKDTSISEVKNQMLDFYLKQFIKGIYKVLGSINLFGNPYVLIRMFAEGTWEIINQPTEGFIKGPVQGAFGIVKGGVFFTRNLIAGSCNSFQAISESVSRGVASLTMDQKFIERREKIKVQKSEHIIKGIQYGGFAVYTGFQVAFTGLVRHPMQGYQNNGMLGGFTGTLKGVAGLVTKPISGTFQGISKFSEGIKNTALLFQDGPNSKRMRHPRIFVSQLQYYKSYNYYDSLAMFILEKASTKYLNSHIHYIYSKIDLLNNMKECLVLTDKFFSKVDLENQKIIMDLQITELQEMTLYENSLVIKMVGGMPLPIYDGNYKQLYNAFKKMKNAEQQIL